MTEKAPFSLAGRNPDVLTCIANLSNDEVFTPPELANQMLDGLAEAWAGSNNGASIWASSSVTFLDPFTKSGVFLREITKRLVAGLASEIPNLEDRVDHILTRQVYGIGITELTTLLARRSVYCSKWATRTKERPHSVARSFTRDWGNIWFERTEHTWVSGRCKFCKAAEAGYERSGDLETHAYAFLHTDDVSARMVELFGEDMKFDVIIGNPPYQLGSDGGTRDVPIYQHFVEQAKRLEPRFLTMVIPARWMAGGLGLSEFRSGMLGDRRMRALVDFHDASNAFPGIDIAGGACYFLWDQEYSGDCAVTTRLDGREHGPFPRDLGEFDVFVRDYRAVAILRKVLSRSEPSIIDILSADKEFGFTSNFRGFHEVQADDDVAIYYTDSGKRLVGYIDRSEITKSANLIDTWKVMISSAYGERGSYPYRILAKPMIAPSPSVCTQTYLFFSVPTAEAAASLESYLGTRFLRFLVSLRKITQHATRSTYTWVPQQSWDRTWTDDELYAQYGITDDEVVFIESMIRPMEAAEVPRNA